MPCTSLTHRGNGCFPNDLEQLHSLPRGMEGRGLGLPGARWAVETWCSSPYPLGFTRQLPDSVSLQCAFPPVPWPCFSPPQPWGPKSTLQRPEAPAPGCPPNALPHPTPPPISTVHTQCHGLEDHLGTPLGVCYPPSEGGGFQEKGRGQLIYPKTSGEDAGQETSFGVGEGVRAGWAAVLGAERGPWPRLPGGKVLRSGVIGQACPDPTPPRWLPETSTGDNLPHRCHQPAPLGPSGPHPQTTRTPQLPPGLWGAQGSPVAMSCSSALQGVQVLRTRGPHTACGTPQEVALPAQTADRAALGDAFTRATCRAAGTDDPGS